jgi:hypothetical protein
MALGSTQPLTEMSTRNLPGGKGRPARKADNLTAMCEPIVYKMWKPRSPTTLWAFTTCYNENFTFYLYPISLIILVLKDRKIRRPHFSKKQYKKKSSPCIRANTVYMDVLHAC